MSFVNHQGRRRSRRLDVIPGFTEYAKALHFRVRVRTTHPSIPTSLLCNRIEAPESCILTITPTDPMIWNGHSLTPADRTAVAFHGSTLTLHSELKNVSTNTLVATTTRTFHSPLPHFTVDDVIRCVVEFDREARPKTKWLGGIDCHHIFFDGFHETSEGYYVPLWGS